MTVAIFIVVVAVAIIIAIAIALSKQRPEVEQALKNISGFVPSQMFASPTKGIALDQASESLAIALFVQGRIETRVFPNHCVTGVDIECTEGASVTKKTGFVSFTTEKSLHEITLCVTLSDQEIPLFRIRLYVAAGKPDAASSLLQRQAMEQANLWRGLLSSIIRTNYGPSPRLATTDTSSIAANIESLHRLHEAGALSDQEFQAAKTRLLEPQ